MNRKLLAAMVVGLIAIAGAAQAGPIIDFETDAISPLAEGLTSAGHPELSFFTDLGSGLETLNGIPEGDGTSLLVRNDTSGNFLKAVFNDGAHSFLSMTFGNDDPAFSNPGDRAVLTVYSGASLVGQTQVVFNRNDIMDQTISWNDGAFDNFTLAYTNAVGNPFTGGGGTSVGLTEVVDNILALGALMPGSVIDFETDAISPLAEGFTSAGHPELSFFTDLGSGLETLNGIPEGDGTSLLVRNDTSGNFLKAVFNDGAHSFLSMTFGNDDPAFSNRGDRAVLTLYSGASLVGQTQVVFNRNDIMDQTISWNDGAFDNFTLAYTNAAGNPFTGGGGTSVGLTEVVDNISADFDVPAAVPEPSTWAMMLLGFGATGMTRRRRRASR